MGLIDEIKTQVKRSGTNKGKFIYFKPGTKIRVRFLSDMEEGVKAPFHDSFALSVNVPCQELFGRACSHDENDELRHRDQFMWSVWDYEAKEVKLLLGPVNNFSPIPQLVAMYDTYGTMTDRDYVITKQGSQQTTSFSVVPMDKVKFRNEKAKPFSSAKALQLLDKAFPDEDSEDDDSGKSKGKGNSKQKSDDDDNDYSSKSPKQLYDLCIERDIDVETKKPKDYYIDKLEEADTSSKDDDWGDDEKVDYSEKTPKELYDLCKERDIEVEPKKPKPYYIEKLEAADAGGSDDGWGDDGAKADEW